MQLFVTENYAEMSKVAAEIVWAVVRAKPGAALGLTTGRTPIGLYRELAAGRAASFNDVQVFCLEEYLGVGPHDRRSLYAWLDRELIAPFRLPEKHIFRLHGESSEPQLSCMQFEARIRQAGGLDLVVEGIGPNGHIGFNEPGSPVDSPTRIVGLHDATVNYNEGYWDAQVPAYGMTTGLQTILSAGKVLLMASGSPKAEPLAKALRGPVTAALPASFLQLAPDLIVVADRAAAVHLEETKEQSH